MNLYIVTGASRGLGLAFARLLAAQPASRLMALSRGGLPAGVAAWRELKVDLADAGAQLDAAAAIRSALGAGAWTRAVLINNAATIDPIGVAGRLDAAAIQRGVALNLAAPMVLMDAFIAASGGIAARAVINISSGSGRRPVSGNEVYCATKAGLDMASRVAALENETAQPGLRITSLAPGIIDTDMQVAARSADPSVFPEVGRFKGFKEQGLLKSGEEVARRILELDAAGKLPAGIADVREVG